MTPSLPTLTIAGAWDALLRGEQRAQLERILPAYIQPRRWFGAKARRMTATEIIEVLPLRAPGVDAAITMVRVSYAEGAADTYVLPLALANASYSQTLLRDLPHAVIAHVQLAGAVAGVLYDPLVNGDFCMALLDLIANEQQIAGEHGQLQASTTSAFTRLRGSLEIPIAPRIVTAEQSNSSIIYGDRLILKVFRRLEPGLNPDLEIGRFLTERSHFTHVPPAAGALEYQPAAGERGSIAILQGFVANQGDAWAFTLRALEHAFQAANTPAPALLSTPLLALSEQKPPHEALAFIGDYLDAARLLGQRTAELHRALAGDTADADFAPEPFAPADQTAIYDSMRARASQAFESLRRVFDAGTLPEAVRADAEQVLNQQHEVGARFAAFQDQPISAARTRFHGDYHLGQVLYTGNDFLIIDFEGEPARPLSERRRKGSPLQDVAGMLRSFHYAPYAALLGQAPSVTFSAEDAQRLDPWARVWNQWVSAAFLHAYLQTAGESTFLPAAPAELARLLDAYLLDKALYELNYELNNRPAWVQIPVQGILQLLGAPA